MKDDMSLYVGWHATLFMAKNMKDFRHYSILYLTSAVLLRNPIFLFFSSIFIKFPHFFRDPISSSIFQKFLLFLRKFLFFCKFYPLLRKNVNFFGHYAALIQVFNLFTYFKFFFCNSSAFLHCCFFILEQRCIYILSVTFV